jgi:hypothetical protein
MCVFRNIKIRENGVGVRNSELTLAKVARTDEAFLGCRDEMKSLNFQ